MIIITAESSILGLLRGRDRAHPLETHAPLATHSHGADTSTSTNSTSTSSSGRNTAAPSRGLPVGHRGGSGSRHGGQAAGHHGLRGGHDATPGECLSALEWHPNKGAGWVGREPAARLALSLITASPCVHTAARLNAGLAADGCLPAGCPPPPPARQRVHRASDGQEKSANHENGRDRGV